MNESIGMRCPIMLPAFTKTKGGINEIDIKNIVKKFIESKLPDGRHSANLANADPLIKAAIIDSFGIIKKLLTFLEESIRVNLSDH